MCHQPSSSALLEFLHVHVSARLCVCVCVCVCARCPASMSFADLPAKRLSTEQGLSYATCVCVDPCLMCFDVQASLGQSRSASGKAIRSRSMARTANGRGQRSECAEGQRHRPCYKKGSRSLLRRQRGVHRVFCSLHVLLFCLHHP